MFDAIWLFPRYVWWRLEVFLERNAASHWHCSNAIISFKFHLFPFSVLWVQPFVPWRRFRARFLLVRRSYWRHLQFRAYRRFSSWIRRPARSKSALKPGAVTVSLTLWILPKVLDRFVVNIVEDYSALLFCPWGLLNAGPFQHNHA